MVKLSVRRSWFEGIPRILYCAVVISALAFLGQARAADQFKSFKLKTLSGETRTLEDFRDKATLIAFFFPSCPYCNRAFPVTVKLYDTYKDRGLKMVWINIVEEEEDAIPDWLAEHQYTVPVLVGASQQYLMRRYDVRMTPEHYLLNPEGEILFIQRGFEVGDESALEENIKKALSLAP